MANCERCNKPTNYKRLCYACEHYDCEPYEEGEYN